MSRIVWTNFEKQLVSDSLVHAFTENMGLTNKSALSRAQLALPLERRIVVTDQRAFSHKARITAARFKAGELRDAAKTVVSAKPPEPPAAEPARKLDTLGEVFELFIDALADRILDKMVAAKQQVEQRVRPEPTHDDMLDAAFFGGKLMRQLQGLSIRTPAKPLLPTVTIIGLNGQQVEAIKSNYPKAIYCFMTAEEAKTRPAQHNDHVILMTKFINHAVQTKYRKHPNLHYCNGGVSELKTLLHGLFAKEVA